MIQMEENGMEVDWSELDKEEAENTLVSICLELRTL